MSKHKILIESITRLKAEELGMTITISRGEDSKDFDHNANMKTYKNVLDANRDKNIAQLCEAFLKLNRVWEVDIRNNIGHGMRMIKEMDE